MANNKRNNTRTRANTAHASARAAGAKLPDDYQSASQDVVSDIVEFEFEGIIYEVDTDKFDDLEMLDTLQVSLSRGIKELLGADQHKTLVAHLKKNDSKGMLRASKVKEFFDVMQGAVGPLV